jgi:hypothetical protein
MLYTEYNNKFFRDILILVAKKRQWINRPKMKITNDKDLTWLINCFKYKKSKIYNKSSKYSGPILTHALWIVKLFEFSYLPVRNNMSVLRTIRTITRVRVSQWKFHSSALRVESAAGRVKTVVCETNETRAMSTWPSPAEWVCSLEECICSRAE